MTCSYVQMHTKKPQNQLDMGIHFRELKQSSINSMKTTEMVGDSCVVLHFQIINKYIIENMPVNETLLDHFPVIGIICFKLVVRETYE